MHCPCFTWAAGPAAAPKRPQRVELDVGGERFSTSRATLLRYPGSVIAALIAEEPGEDGTYFLDRSGQHFGYVLNFLRDGPERWLPPTAEQVRNELLQEARCLGLEELEGLLRQSASRPGVEQPREAPREVKVEAAPVRVYQKAPLPRNEEERLLRLDGLGIRDTDDHEPRFDCITTTVAALFNVPMVLVSLIYRDDQFMKSRVGMEASCASREFSMCSWLLTPEDPSCHALVTIEDTALDPRTELNPWVLNEPGLRFYTGCPLVTSDGIRLGSLCIAGMEPRPFKPAEAQILANFGMITSLEIERQQLQKPASEPAAAAAALQGEDPAAEAQPDFAAGPHREQRMRDALEEGLALVWARPDCADWRVLYANVTFTQMTGSPFMPRASGPGFPEFVEEGAPSLWDHLQLSSVDAKHRRTMFECVAGAAVQGGLPRSFALQAEAARTSTKLSCRFSPAEMPLDVAAAAVRATVSTSCQGSPTGQGLRLAGFPAGRLYFATMARIQEADAAAGCSYPGRAINGVTIARSRPRQSPFQDVRLLNMVGEGSFGKVYLALWGGTNVAVKVIRSTQEAEASHPALEAVVSASITHENLVQTYKYDDQVVLDVDEPLPRDGLKIMETWIVQEWCDRGTLRNYCTHPRADSKGLLEVLEIGMEIAAAASYLHYQGLVHGDLTTNNVLMKTAPTPKGFICKICDFGLARIFNEKEEVVTQSLGTVTHMPPELFSADVSTFTLTPKVDVYSIAMILYETVSGLKPFDGLTPVQIIMQVSRGERMKLNLSVPVWFQAMYLRCVSPEPTARPTCAELLEVMRKQRAALGEANALATARAA